MSYKWTNVKSMTINYKEQIFLIQKEIPSIHGYRHF